MTIALTRRRLIQALPFIGAAAALPVVANEPAPAFEPLVLPEDRMDMVQRPWTPQERFEYHYRELTRAMNALVPEQDSRWMVTLFGKNGHPPSMAKVARIDLVSEPEPRVKGGIMMVERMTDLIDPVI